MKLAKKRSGDQELPKEGGLGRLIDVVSHSRMAAGLTRVQLLAGRPIWPGWQVLDHTCIMGVNRAATVVWSHEILDCHRNGLLDELRRIYTN